MPEHSPYIVGSYLVAGSALTGLVAYALARMSRSRARLTSEEMAAGTLPREDGECER